MKIYSLFILFCFICSNVFPSELATSREFYFNWNELGKIKPKITGENCNGEILDIDPNEIGKLNDIITENKICHLDLENCLLIDTNLSNQPNLEILFKDCTFLKCIFFNLGSLDFKNCTVCNSRFIIINKLAFWEPTIAKTLFSLIGLVSFKTPYEDKPRCYKNEESTEDLENFKKDLIGKFQIGGIQINPFFILDHVAKCYSLGQLSQEYLNIIDICGKEKYLSIDFLSEIKNIFHTDSPNNYDPLVLAQCKKNIQIFEEITKIMLSNYLITTSLTDANCNNNFHRNVAKIFVEPIGKRNQICIKNLYIKSLKMLDYLCESKKLITFQKCYFDFGPINDSQLTKLIPLIYSDDEEQITFRLSETSPYNLLSPLKFSPISVVSQIMMEVHNLIYNHMHGGKLLLPALKLDYEFTELQLELMLYLQDKLKLNGIVASSVLRSLCYNYN